MRFLVAALAVAVGLAAAPATADVDVVAPIGDDEILVLGDSLCVGARQHGFAERLEDAGWVPTFRCESGEPVPWGLAEVADMESVPTVVVVALGTNPRAEEPGFLDHVGDLRAALIDKGAQRLVWVDYADRRGTYTDKTRLLHEFAGQHGDEVVRWSKLVALHPEWFRSDGLHYRPDGVAAWSAAIAATVETPDADPALRSVVARLSQALADGLEAAGVHPTAVDSFRRLHS